MFVLNWIKILLYYSFVTISGDWICGWGLVDGWVGKIKIYNHLSQVDTRAGTELGNHRALHIKLFSLFDFERAWLKFSAFKKRLLEILVSILLNREVKW